MINRSRRGTIISPTGHIQSYAFRRFLALILAGSGLAFVGGYINAICIINTFQVPISAATGSTTKMVIQITQGNFGVALHFFLLIFSFVLGSSIAAALVGGSSFRIHRLYGLVLLLEAFALAFGYLFEGTKLSLNKNSVFLPVGAYSVSLGCGLQNGMCTTFSGAVIRTTHVTGILTDIGLIIGQAIFHQRTRKHLWKLKVLVPLFVAFCFGGVIGWLSFHLLHSKAILLPCAAVGILGIAHLCYCKIILLHQARQIRSKYRNRNDSIILPIPTIQIDWAAKNAFDKQTDRTNRDDNDEQQNETEILLEAQNPFNQQIASDHKTNADMATSS